MAVLAISLLVASKDKEDKMERAFRRIGIHSGLVGTSDLRDVEDRVM